ncbi:MAG TPA: hypothetical protein VHN77_08515 [Phycisphaerales bacterium]|nr:hypothetical protein [Phycisphaerales bacterium]
MPNAYQLAHEMRCKYARTASIAVPHPDGTKFDTHHGSWLGAVKAALPGESWPEHEGVPLHGVAQICLCEVPVRPPQLRGVSMLCVFVHNEDGYSFAPKHSLDTAPQGWLVREYRLRSTADLVRVAPPLPPACGAARITFRRVIDDMPREGDADRRDVADFERETGCPWYETLKTYGKTKFGGWPCAYQDQVTWSDYPLRDTAKPEFVFQIGSDDGVDNLMFGDGGMLFFGYNASRPDGPWFLEMHEG